MAMGKIGAVLVVHKMLGLHFIGAYQQYAINPGIAPAIVDTRNIQVRRRPLHL